MQDFSPLSETLDLPAAGNLELEALGYERWREAANAHADPSVSEFADKTADIKAYRRIYSAIFGNSPFLTQCVLGDPLFFRDLLAEGPDVAAEKIMTGLADDAKEGVAKAAGDLAELGRSLRIARRRMALAVALADIANLWDVTKVTETLSHFADIVLSIAARNLLKIAADRGDIHLANQDDPEIGSGLIILGLGKLGAHELNYSSDIDLIILYDGQVIGTDKPDDLQRCFVRIARDLVNLLSERTADGYVFRTDLRIRPDPYSTPPAMSVLAAETYYESVGQNWERAAMIKARPVAGDLKAGNAFLERLRPFIWRRYLDFAAIQDIHSIKRQINAHYGGADIGVPGHNIKLGRGGIREIEFFVQTQQLIWGGREPDIRRPPTCEAMKVLAETGRVSKENAAELTAAYLLLRRIEHRLQMIDDQQTHILPADAEGLERLAIFLGFADADEFGRELTKHLRAVEAHYAELFEGSPALSADAAVSGNLIFTGTEEDPETLETLSNMGFSNPKFVAETVRGWHHGRRRATRSVKARQLLTELMPALLAAFAASPAGDAALAKFDDFLSRLPAGVQLFSMFQANPGLLDLVSEVMGTAPRLADYLSRTPAALDIVLDASFFEDPPKPEVLAARLDRFLARVVRFEDVLGASRRWANDCKLQVGIQILRNLVDCRVASMALSDIADIALERLQPLIEAEFESRHGRVAGGQMVVVALGKLGGREMTPTSDLDLIFVYEHDEDDASDGNKSLAPSHYFSRLSQSLINALTAPTAEGKLFEVDMRLRPSGTAGPIASSLEAFIRYHEEKSWTWEHMALAKARVICGPNQLRAKVEGIIRATLTRPRDAVSLLADVADMRVRMDREKHTDFIWDAKYLRGGLVDIEFMSQYLQLRHAAEHPGILSANTHDALAALGAENLIERGAMEDLTTALHLWQAVQNMLRLTIEGYFQPDREGDVPEALKLALARAGGAPDYSHLKAELAETARRVTGHYRNIIELPARKISRE